MKYISLFLVCLFSFIFPIYAEFSIKSLKEKVNNEIEWIDIQINVYDYEIDFSPKYFSYQNGRMDAFKELKEYIDQIQD